MDKIELRGKKIVELISQFILGDVNCDINYDFHYFTFGIYNGPHGWNWRGDISDVMHMSPNECAWEICITYRDWVLDTYFRNEYLEDLLHSRKEQPL